MTDAELLKNIKIGLFGTAAGTWRDDMLKNYINEAREFLRDAGVSEATLNSEASVGCIQVLVNDLWNYSGGGVKISAYATQRAIQLATKKGGESNAQT